VAGELECQASGALVGDDSILAAGVDAQGLAGPAVLAVELRQAQDRLSRQCRQDEK